jgi:hypothetical protein
MGLVGEGHLEHLDPPAFTTLAHLSSSPLLEKSEKKSNLQTTLIPNL